jgi:hypothetical protein
VAVFSLESRKTVVLGWLSAGATCIPKLLAGVTTQFFASDVTSTATH